MLQSEKKINSGRGHLGWESGRIRKGTGDGRENGGGGSSKKVGKGRIMGGRRKLRNKAQYFAIEKVLKEGSQKKRCGSQ